MSKKKVGELTVGDTTFRVFAWSDLEGELQQQLVIENPSSTLRVGLTGWMHPLGEFLREAAVRSEVGSGAALEDVEEFYRGVDRVKQKAKWTT